VAICYPLGHPTPYANDLKTTFTPDSVAHPFSIAVHKQYIYWTDWTLNGIYRAGKVDSSTWRTPLDNDVFNSEAYGMGCPGE
jgi:hypothetical protein